MSCRQIISRQPRDPRERPAVQPLPPRVGSHNFAVAHDRRRSLIPWSSVRTCHVASPSAMRRRKNSARRRAGSHRFCWMADKLVAATWSSVASRRPTSASATASDISGHRNASGNGSRMPSATMTGTQPSATASTNRGLHGAHPSGHRQNTDRAISAR
ncbi:hypothetical protein GW17_00042132 [Ensete ventricosum]|nr:hypothetical protein GW17_00042132 [Ensete ventricosum]RZS21576.1 hypothetical protein BHM03_00054223 [Ensete ventricosum]